MSSSNKSSSLEKDKYKRPYDYEIWTYEQDEFLKEHYPKNTPKQFQALFFKEFPGEKRTQGSIRIRASMWGVKSASLFTKDQDAFLIEKYKEGLTTERIATELNASECSGGVTRTSSGIRSRIRRLIRKGVVNRRVKKVRKKKA